MTETAPKTVKWLNGNVLAFGLTSFLSGFSHEMATSVLPQFMQAIGASAAALGFIEGVADALSSFVKLGAGYHSDRIGHRKPWTVFGYILTGKYGIGKTSLVKEVAKMHGERWHFLFADFSEPPSKVCNDLLAALRPRRPSGKRIRYLGYKQSRSQIVDLTGKTRRRCVIVLDNIEKLTPQRLGLIRYLAWDKPCLFIAIPERFLPEDDLSRLRACLYPSKVIRLRHLSAKQTERFFQS